MSMKKAILYIHGKDGSPMEAEQYRRNCPEFDIIGVDYKGDYPWNTEKQMKEAYEKLQKDYEEIFIIANSIGAYYAMHAFQKCSIGKALFISPILDMEKLILDMMRQANVTEKELYERGEISTEFGEVLSWEYLNFVRENPITWEVPTEVLYAGRDNLTSRETVDTFVKNHHAVLTVMENGEHWFHTKEQMDFLNVWMKKAIEKR